MREGRGRDREVTGAETEWGIEAETGIGTTGRCHVIEMVPRPTATRGARSVLCRVAITSTTWYVRGAPVVPTAGVLLVPRRLLLNRHVTGRCDDGFVRPRALTSYRRALVSHAGPFLFGHPFRLNAPLLQCEGPKGVSSIYGVKESWTVLSDWSQGASH